MYSLCFGAGGCAGFYSSNCKYRVYGRFFLRYIFNEHGSFGIRHRIKATDRTNIDLQFIFVARLHQ